MTPHPPPTDPQNDPQLIAYRALCQRFDEVTEEARRVTSAAGLQACWPYILVGDMKSPNVVLGIGVHSWKRIAAEDLANAEEVKKAMQDRINLWFQVEQAWQYLPRHLRGLVRSVQW